MANKRKRKSKRGGCVSDRPGRPEKPKPAKAKSQRPPKPLSSPAATKRRSDELE